MNYLGIMISRDSSMNREVETRIGCREFLGNEPGNLEEERTE